MSTPKPLHTPLHQINTLIAGITQVNAIVFDEIQSAINFSIYEGEPLQEKSNLAESAQRIIALYKCEGKSLAFAHCDLSCYSPLWHRINLLKALDQLATKSKALLLITGLKETFSPSGRWTPSAKRAYTEAVKFTESLATKNSRGASHLHILFI